ncbi:MAG: peptidylprolyl isomerase [Giesbergeria sp.]
MDTKMKQMKDVIRRAMALFGLTLALAATAAGNDPVLARLASGETITEEDLSGYLDRRVDLQPASRNAWGVENVVREMAMTRVLMLEGKAIGHPQKTGKDTERFDDIYGLDVFKKLSPACTPPADADAARKFYDENPQAFRVPPMARLSRIMLPVTATVDDEPAMGWLLTQAKAIASGARKLEEVAERAATAHKLDPQGDLGWVMLTNDISILRALADAKQGELVGPVREGEFGYLFYVSARRESRLLAWDQVAASAATRAVSYCREQASAQTQEILFKKYGVVVDKEAVRALFTKKDIQK